MNHQRWYCNSWGRSLKECDCSEARKKGGDRWSCKTIKLIIIDKWKLVNISKVVEISGAIREKRDIKDDCV